MNETKDKPTNAKLQKLRYLSAATRAEIRRLLLRSWTAREIRDHLELGPEITLDSLQHWLKYFRRRNGLPAGQRGRNPKRTRLERIARNTLDLWRENMTAGEIRALLAELNQKHGQIVQGGKV